MSALDDGEFGCEPVTDLRELADMRKSVLEDWDYRLPLQDAERAAGLTEADIWRFLDEPAAATG
ncbi:hypothetical protein MINS_12390 [Mycolicibacterium insubricum]|uniref:Uncharacterized protein n=1 Tax=Mycolicibacterium insubricum TaxID=444597 RepID=A0A1X0CS63_9MYCO|nr:hypothetical protein [Mycolicibacterium insubricum]ORA62819.1 hypothetical protein BST26_20660 [Mycolicibacterium insubricum]BBZ65810.1 hypothetical protein MINS_12390 [Mycolicibacterium insubricum]